MNTDKIEITILTELKLQLEIIAGNKKTTPTKLIQTWIKDYVKENKDFIYLIPPDEMKRLEEEYVIKKELITTKFKSLLNADLPEAANKFILWNQKHNYATNFIDNMARLDTLDEIKSMDMKKFLSESDNGSSYEEYYEHFADDFLSTNKQEYYSYLDFCGFK